MLFANILSIILVNYLFWKRLKEDYSTEKIFNFSFLVIMGFSIFLVISKLFFPSWWFWFSFLGLIISFLISEKVLKLRFYESLETCIISFITYLTLYFLASTIIHSDLIAFILFWVNLLFVFIFFFLSSHYRKFNWYKSGKVGFSGLFTLGSYFLIRLVLSFWIGNADSYIEKIDPVMSGIVAFFAFLMLYNLARVKR